MHRSPTLDQRLAARTWPASTHIMYQRWTELLFLHWRYDAAELQSTLPKGLFVDTHDGHAYLGIVPFFMRRIRPRFLPCVPGISDFLELNLRTYVHDENGVPGVWFYSLDANQWLAVKVARTLFHLPYCHARMSATRTDDGWIRYCSERLDSNRRALKCGYEYAQGNALLAPQSGSLEFFLLERYHLYSHSDDRIRRGTVAHAPYPVHEAKLRTWDENLIVMNGFIATGRPPDHVAMSPGVNVELFPLQDVSGSADAPIL